MPWLSCFSRCSALGTLLALLPMPLMADVVRDGSLGEDVPLGGDADTFVIEEIHGERAGENLFHSFSEFDLDSDQAAIFRSAFPTSNIIGRITGGPSSIGGLIQSSVPGTNLFLINPRGITFTETARLDVGGAFHVTTADFLEFGGDPDQRFFADPGRNSVLSPVDVSAFGFLSASPAAVAITDAQLEVPSGDLSIVSGDIQIRGFDAELMSRGGAIRLIAVGSPGRVALRPMSPEEMWLSEFASLGQIQLRDVFVVQDSTPADVDPDLADDVPSLFEFQRGLGLEDDFFFGDETAEDFDVRDSTTRALGEFFAREQAAASALEGQLDGLRPGIELIGENISLESSVNLVTGSAAGAGADIRIFARNGLSTADFVSIAAAVGARGRAGNVLITALDSLSLGEETEISSGARPFSTASNDLDRGDAGIVRIDTGRLFIGPDSLIRADGLGFGNAGSIEILAQESVLLDGAELSASVEAGLGSAGRILISTGDFTSQNGSTLGAPSFGFFGGTSGSVEVRASRSLRFLDSAIINISVGSASGRTLLEAPVVEVRSATIISDSLGLAPGSGSSVEIRASESITIDRASIQTSGAELADSGAIELDAPRISVVDAELAADTGGRGDAGRIQIDSDSDLTLEGVEISTTSGIVFPRDEDDSSVSEFGNSGDVAIRAIATQIRGDSTISTSTGSNGNAGNVGIDSADSVLVSDSRIQSDSSGSGDAGTIRVATRQLSLESDAELGTQTSGSGMGGDIVIEAEDSVRIADATVASNSSGSGNGGDIAITATASIDVSGAQAAIRAGSAGTGDGGSIQLRSQDIRIRSGAEVEAASSGSGDAGSVRVEADRVGLDAGSIRTSSTRTTGGNIDLAVRDQLLIQNGSRIETNVSEANGDGGQIRIESDLILLDQSRISADAKNGDGGEIQIRSRFLLSDFSDNSITARSEGGRSGRVDTEIRATDPMRSMRSLEASFRSAADLLRPACDVRDPSALGSLFVDSRRGIPVSPDGVLLAFDVPRRPSGEAAAGTATDAQPGGDPWGVDLEQPRTNISPAADLALAPLTAGGSSLRSTAFSAVAGVLDFERAMTEARDFEERGDYVEANESLIRALTIAQREDEPGRVAAVLGRLGNIYTVLGEYERAEELLAEAIRMAKRAGAPREASTVLNNLGNQLVLDGRAQEALEVYREARLLGSGGGSELLVAQASANAARAAFSLGESRSARALADYAERTLQSLVTSRDRLYAQIHIAGTRARLAEAVPSRREAELLRAHTLLRSAGEAAEAIGDARAAAFAWGYLGSLYASENRNDEALTLNRRALDWADASDATDTAYLWHWQTGKALWAMGRADEAVMAYRRAVEGIEDAKLETALAYGSAHTSFADGAGRAYLDLVSALLSSASRVPEQRARSLTLEARARLEQLKAAELRNYFRDECVAALEARAISVERVEPGAAVIYPILLPDRVELLVSRGERIDRFAPESSASRDAVIVKVEALRTALERGAPREVYLPLSQALYDWLVRPYITTLNEADIKTLVFVPDSALRSLPIAALHDGRGFLVESHALAVTPGLALTDPKPIQRSETRLLLAGLSLPRGERPALTNVPLELKRIHDLYGGETLLDPDFTTAQLADRIDGQSFTMVHLASHANFSGDPETSFVATFDGELSLEELGTLVGKTRFRRLPLELLVLSACETAAGSDRAALGLAGVALEAGARSAVGSLFRIRDDASLELMTAFYSELTKREQSRAEALRRAQLTLLEHESLGHPGNWAPFLLIGNWL